MKNPKSNFKISIHAPTNFEFKFVISDIRLNFSYSVPMHMMRKYSAKPQGLAHIFYDL